MAIGNSVPLLVHLRSEDLHSGSEVSREVRFELHLSRMALLEQRDRSLLRPKNGWNMFLFQNFGHTTLEDTLWLFNIAMENGPFIDGFPIKNGDFP